MSPAGRKTPPDQMADRLWRLVGGSPREGRPYLPTEGEFRAATGWFLPEEPMRPNRGWRPMTRPPYAPPSPGPGISPEPVEAPPWIEPEIAREPWREEDRRQRREAERRVAESRRRQAEGTEGEPEPVPPQRPEPAKRKSRFKSLEL